MQGCEHDLLRKSFVKTISSTTCASRIIIVCDSNIETWRSGKSCIEIFTPQPERCIPESLAQYELSFYSSASHILRLKAWPPSFDHSLQNWPIYILQLRKLCVEISGVTSASLLRLRFSRQLCHILWPLRRQFSIDTRTLLVQHQDIYFTNNAFKLLFGTLSIRLPHD